MGDTAASASELNVLVIDDDDVDIENVRRSLRRVGRAARLWVARDGLEGLSTLRYDGVPQSRRVVLLDLNMPKMSGLEFLNELRSDPALKDTCVIVLTTSGDDGDLKSAEALGVAGYLLKPIDSAHFAELLRRCVPLEA